MYSIQELADIFGMKPRTIKYYIEIGAVPRSEGPRCRAYYTEEHVRALREIRRTIHDRVTLRDLAERRELSGA